MRGIILWGGVAGLTACLIRPTFVSITPDFGYADGCIDVVVQGSNLGSTATARVGSDEFLALDPLEDDPALKRPEHASDVGFGYTGMVGASPSGEPGWFDVTITLDGEDMTLNDGFYFGPCPASFILDQINVPETAAPGDPLSFVGCGLGDDVTIQFIEDSGAGALADTAPLVSDCSTARVHADVPALAPGSYEVQVLHTDGTLYEGVCGVDSGDTGITCAPLLIEVTARRGAK